MGITKSGRQEPLGMGLDAGHWVAEYHQWGRLLLGSRGLLGSGNIRKRNVMVWGDVGCEYENVLPSSPDGTIGFLLEPQQFLE